MSVTGTRHHSCWTTRRQYGVVTTPCWLHRPQNLLPSPLDGVRGKRAPCQDLLQRRHTYIQVYMTGGNQCTKTAPTKYTIVSERRQIPTWCLLRDGLSTLYNKVTKAAGHETCLKYSWGRIQIRKLYYLYITPSLDVSFGVRPHNFLTIDVSGTINVSLESPWP